MHPQQDQRCRCHAGDGVGDEEQPQADAAEQHRDDPRAYASSGQRGTEQPEGLRTPLRRHHLGEQRLAGRLVDLEGEAEQRGSRRRSADTRRDGDDEQGDTAAEEPEHDRRASPEAVSHPPAGQP